MRSALLLVVACGSRNEPKPQPVAREAGLDAAIDVDASIDATIDARALDAFGVKTLEGPFASIKAYCTSKPDIDEPGYEVQCNTSQEWSRSLRLKKPSPPFDEARIFVVEGLDPHCQLGIRTGKEWYVLGEAIMCLGDRAKSTLDSDTKFVVDDEQRLIVKTVYDQSLEGYSPEKFDRTHFEVWTICGIGPSGKPSCTEVPIAGTYEDHESGKPTKKSKFALAVTLGKGEITVEGDMSTFDRYMLQSFPTGTYALVFP